MADPRYRGRRPGSQRARALRPGDLIGVIAPAGCPDQTALEEGLARIESWGFRTVVGRSASLQWGHLAGSDAERASDLNRFWADPDIAGILCARGGYGSMRILPLIDWEVVRSRPKFLCGFSDITALHAAMELEAGLVTFHGPMPAAFGSSEAHAYNARGLRAAMTDPVPGLIPWPDLHNGPAAFHTIFPGTAEGRLAGGNLSLLCSLMGTPWEPDFAGRLVMLEEVDESPPRVERMLTQLLLSGKLHSAAGILFGNSSTCENPPEGKVTLTLFEVLADRLGSLGIPVLYGFPCGHDPFRATLPLGALARMDAGTGTLVVQEPTLTT